MFIFASFSNWESFSVQSTFHLLLLAFSISTFVKEEPGGGSEGSGRIRSIERLKYLSKTISGHVRGRGFSMNLILRA